jgi:hypothetical protein
MPIAIDAQLVTVKGSQVLTNTVCGHYGGYAACKAAQEAGKEYFVFNGRLYMTPAPTTDITRENGWNKQCFPFYSIEA